MNLEFIINSKFCILNFSSILACLLVLTTLCAPVRAAVYYVSPSGNDANSGSISEPFQTIQKAVDSVQAGDTILIKPGTYPEHVELDGSRHATGRPGLPITIQSENWYPNAAHDRALDVIITAERGVEGYEDNAYHAISISDHQKHIVLRGLLVDRARDKNLVIANSDSITVEDCISQRAAVDGIHASSRWGGQNNIIIRRCVVHNNGNAGIQLRTGNPETGVTNALVEDCDSFANGALVTENAEGIEVIGSVVRNVVIRRSLSFNNISSNIAFSDPVNSTVEDCLAWGTTTRGNADGRSIIIGNHGQGTGSMVRRCVSFDSPRVGLIVTNAPESTVYSNLIFDCGFQRPGENPTSNKAGIGIGAPNVISRNNGSFDNAFDYGGHPDSSAEDFGIGSSAVNFNSDFNLIKDGIGVSQHGEHTITVDSAQRLTPDEGLLVADKTRARQLAENYASAAEAGTLTWAKREQFLAEMADALRPAENSPLIDAGDFLVFTTEAGMGSVIPVDRDPRRFFRTGTPEIGLQGDLIQIDDKDDNPDTMIRARIVDLSANNITVETPVSFPAGAGIHPPYIGNRPDIGAFEFGGAGFDVLPDSKTTIFVDNKLSAPCAGNTYSIEKRGCSAPAHQGYEAYNTIQAAADRVQAGDQVLIREGLYNVPGVIQGSRIARIFDKHGTSAEPIIIKNYGSVRNVE